LLASGTPVHSPPPGPVEIHPTFLPTAPHPGNVVVIVESTKFYVHRDLLIFASSFFECLFRGDWRETSSDTSTHVDDSQDRRLSVLSSRGSFVSTDTSPSPDKDSETSSLGDDDGAAAAALADLPSLTLTDTAESNDGAIVSISSFADEMEDAGVDLVSDAEEKGPSQPLDGPEVEAKIHLREESAVAVHDALHFIYPQYALASGWYARGTSALISAPGSLECTVTWVNAPQSVSPSELPFL
jgi:hypothetical protein